MKTRSFEPECPYIGHFDDSSNSWGFPRRCANMNGPIRIRIKISYLQGPENHETVIAGAPARAHTHTHTHAHTRARARTHTHEISVVLSRVFSWKRGKGAHPEQTVRERPINLRFSAVFPWLHTSFTYRHSRYLGTGKTLCKSPVT
jgi:hypothetical protein